MNGQAIVDKIISDANDEAAAIISEAERRAQGVISEAKVKAERNLLGSNAEAEAKAKSILDGKAASARLDCAKIELAEKRRVLDGVYESALKKLKALDKKSAVALADGLLNKFAEEGDEIVFAADYKFVSEVTKLSVVAERKLKFSQNGNVCGGFVLKGVSADKDISYAALLAADREENVSALAAEIFVG